MSNAFPSLLTGCKPRWGFYGCISNLFSIHLMSPLVGPLSLDEFGTNLAVSVSSIS